jgi:ABC-type enterochelin transport system ATPase subunit
MIDYSGARWYKCDLHLHTPASKCFLNKEITPEEWVNKAIEMQLDCIAVTDHNTGEWIDKIKVASSGKNIIVFPGVEITCDTGKIHVLVLFDVGKKTQDIDDFLIKCGIPRESFASQNAHSPKSVLDVAEIANTNGAVVIPAHIDESNGVGLYASKDSIIDLYKKDYINAVQIVHKEYLETINNTKTNEELKEKINAYCNNPSPEIGFSSITNGYNSVRYAKEQNLSLVTFSDNPDENEPAKHGLDGIGKLYTWIKMEEKPTIESLRQAFLFNDRVINCFKELDRPYIFPNLWIKSIKISDTLLTKDRDPFVVEFSPQLTTIIGGRGSGKSSIFRFIRGVFSKTSDISDLGEVLKDFKDFFRINSDELGVLTENSSIVIEFVRDELLYQIKYCNSNIKIQQRDEESGAFSDIEDKNYINFFNFEEYSQKQIYEIAQKPNSLRDRIDSAIPEIDELKSKQDQIKNDFFETSASVRTIQQKISKKGRLNTILSDLNNKIKLLKSSGIPDMIVQKDKNQLQKKVISNFILQYSSYSEKLENAIKDFVPVELDYAKIESVYRDSIKSIVHEFITKYDLFKTEIERNLLDYKSNIQSLKDAFNKSEFSTNLKEIDNRFNLKKKELEEKGIDDYAKLEGYLISMDQVEKDLKEIKDNEIKIQTLLHKKDEISKLYIENALEISKKRQDFVKTIINEGSKVQIKINSFRDKKDFVDKLLHITQKYASSYIKDYNMLRDFCYNGNFKDKIQEVRKIFHDARKDLYSNQLNLSGYFYNMVKILNDSQYDEIDLMLPEDEIQVTYKNKLGQYKLLSSASAGQKTTAILTFILSFGEDPLLLDQPEDDLDNHLVSDLIVERLKTLKLKRQIIVITHNANIPVNGDAEYVVSLSSDSKYLAVQSRGTLDDKDVKDEICDIMEGGAEAFKMRSLRYKLENSL